MREDINFLKEKMQEVEKIQQTFKGEILHEEIKIKKIWRTIAITFIIISVFLLCQLIYLYNDIGVEEIVETTTTYEDIIDMDANNNGNINIGGDVNNG